MAEYEASGLNQKEFCQSRGLSSWTLSRYRKRLRESRGEAVAATKWVAVEMTAASGGGDSGLAISCGRGRRIEVGCGFDLRTLIQLLGVMERS